VSTTNDRLSKGCYVVLHLGAEPSTGMEKNGSPLVVRGRGSRFILRDDIWIERLDEQVARNVQQACDPPNYKIETHGTDRHLYAFVCRFPANEEGPFLGALDLDATVSLSRLVYPTSTGGRYRARIVFGGEDSPIQGIPSRGMNP
jgi:hypothetical protein